MSEEKQKRGSHIKAEQPDHLKPYHMFITCIVTGTEKKKFSKSNNNFIVSIKCKDVTMQDFGEFRLFYQCKDEEEQERLVKFLESTAPYGYFFAKMSPAVNTYKRTAGWMFYANEIYTKAAFANALGLHNKWLHKPKHEDLETSCPEFASTFSCFIGKQTTEKSNAKPAEPEQLKNGNGI